MPIIIAAASGTGKTSLVNAVVKADPHCVISVSHTTRPQRPNEKNGVHYHFIDALAFNQLIGKHAFLEYAKVFDHYYGTSYQWVDEQLSLGKNVIFEIDWQGARQIRQTLKDAVSVFILPPSLPILENRLRERAQDNPAVIARRMQQAKAEMSHYAEFDYVIVNNDFDKATQDLLAAIQAAKLRTHVQQENLKGLLQELLA